MQQQKAPYSPVVFDSHFIRFISASSNRIQLHFLDQKEEVAFHCEQILKKINCKTVHVALERSDEATVTAKFMRKSKLEYHLIINVREEFLLPIQQILVFVGRKMSKNEKLTMKAKRQGKDIVQKLKKQIADLTGQFIETGSIKSSAASIAFCIPFNTTLFHFSLNFTNMKGNIVSIKFFYLQGSKTKEEIEVVPKQGLLVYGQTDICLLVDRKKYKDINIQVQGQFEQINYTVKKQRVQDRQKILSLSQKKQKIIIIVVFLLFFFGMYECSSKSQKQNSPLYKEQL